MTFRHCAAETGLKRRIQQRRPHREETRRSMVLVTMFSPVCPQAVAIHAEVAVKVASHVIGERCRRAADERRRGSPDHDGRAIRGETNHEQSMMPVIDGWTFSTSGYRPRRHPRGIRTAVDHRRKGTTCARRRSLQSHSTSGADHVPASAPIEYQRRTLTVAPPGSISPEGIAVGSHSVDVHAAPPLRGRLRRVVGAGSRSVRDSEGK